MAKTRFIFLMLFVATIYAPSFTLAFIEDIDFGNFNDTGEDMPDLESLTNGFDFSSLGEDGPNADEMTDEENLKGFLGNIKGEKIEGR